MWWISGHLIRPSQAYFCSLSQPLSISAPSDSGEGEGGEVLVGRGRGEEVLVGRGGEEVLVGRGGGAVCTCISALHAVYL